jgi:hypothetical protein|tara:strand:- start:92 stop:331 length:240 start_codon:yes stop_codon:yes gene_type:complete
MDKELQEYYEETFSTLATKGWRQFEEDLSRVRANVDNLSTVTDTQNLYFRKGQLDIIDLVLGRKAACEQAYEELNETTF